jgi:hypothetical protein
MAWLDCGFVGDSFGEMVGLTPSLDNSIYSENGSNSNGLGALFSGRNSQATPGIRRALLQFDIAGSIPAGSIIHSVSLGIYQLKHAANSTIETFELRPILSAWGQGTSTGGGSGGAATAGDATWTHRLFSSDLWMMPGGDFGAISGTGTIGIVESTLYTFSSQPGLVADVQGWLNSPGTNFGWILRAANESTLSNSREFGSRESPLSQRPTLMIEYTAVPEPGAALLLGIAAMFVSGNAFRRRPPWRPGY